MAKKIPKIKSKDKSDYKKNVMNIKKKRQIVNVVLTVLLILIIASSLAILLRNQFDMPVFEKINSLFSKKQDYAVIVNQEPITISELNERYDMIPAEYQQYVTKEDLLEQLIDEKILMKKAQELNIVVTDDDVDSYIFNITAESGTTVADFEALLMQNGLTLDDAKTVYKRSLTLNKVVELLMFQNLEVKEIDVEDYYYQNQEIFTSPESINISHILICHEESERCVSNLTKVEAKTKAEMIIGLINDENFGDLAIEYSNEPAAQVTLGNLGWVNREIPFDQTFLNASFLLKEGEISKPIETVFGYHIIKLFEKRPEEVIGLEVVYDSIEQTLIAELQSVAYLNYMDQFRNESEISYFKLEQ